MSVKDLKRELVALSADERAEVAAFLFQLRHRDDADYQEKIQRRLDDKDPSHWLSLNEFEKRLNSN